MMHTADYRLPTADWCMPVWRRILTSPHRVPARQSPTISMSISISMLMLMLMLMQHHPVDVCIMHHMNRK